MEETIYNKIYARTNDKGVVARIFSEAFDTPKDGDVCIDETNTDRHGANAYQVYDEDGIANYQIVNGKMVERDKTADIYKLNKDLLRAKREPLLEAFDKWEKAVIRHRENESDSIMAWYEDLLDLKESAFINIPERVKYYQKNY